MSSGSLTRRLVFGSDPRRTLVRVLVLAVLSFVTFKWVLIPIRAEGISMAPTYQSGSLNLVNRLAYQRRKPGRGDIVAIKLAGPHVLYVKRIIGLPGEHLAIEHGQVYINGAPLSEPYVKNRRGWDVPEIGLTAREYFVIGDNRGMRAADHDFGRVDVSRILGRVIF
ncbi:MAG: signal peptidase I [Vicinamibacterales bacterium]